MHDKEAGLTLAALEQAGEVHRVGFGGGAVVWRRFGNGAPLVLLHGGHGRWTHWARNIRALARHFTVWVPDLPGYGDSDPPLGGSLDDIAAATLKTLDALVPPEAPLRVVAFSFGSLVAAQLAVRRGAIAALALLGPAGHGGVRRPRGELRSWRALPAGSPGWTETMRHNLAMHMLHDPRTIDALALEIHADACMRTRFHSKSLSRSGGLQAMLQAYPGPLLLAWGEHDVTADPARAAAAVAAGRPHCASHVLPDAGHWVQYESADAVNTLLLSWLQAIDSQECT